MVNLLGSIGTGATIAITINAIDNFSSVFNKASLGIGAIELSMKAATIAITATAGALTAIGVASLKAAADFEQTQVAFETMLGSAELANEFLEELADFARTTPFTIQGVEQSARQLMAVGFAADDVLPTLKMVGDLASGLGMGEAGLQRLILNLGQVQAQGKLTGRELRDFAVAGIPLLDELGKVLGKSTTEIQELVSAGEISTADVLAAFEAMTSKGGRFADLMVKQAETVNGKFSNLKDTISLMGRDIGAEFLPVIKDLADLLLTRVLPSFEPLIPLLGEFFRQALESVLPHVEDISNKFVALATILLRDIFPAVIPLVTLVGTTLRNAFFAILDAIQPILPVLVNLGQLIFENAKEMIQNLLPSIQQLIPKIQDFFASLEPLIPKLFELAETIVKNVLAVAESLIPALSTLVPVIMDVIDVIVVILPVIKDFIVSVVNLAENIIGGAAPVLRVLKDIILDLVEPIKTVVGWLIKIIDAIASFLGTSRQLSDSSDKYFENISKGAQEATEETIKLTKAIKDNDKTSSKKSSNKNNNGVVTAPTIHLTPEKSYVGPGEIPLPGQIIKLNDFIISQGKVYQPHKDDVIVGRKNGAGFDEGGITIIVEGDIYGTDPDQMAQAFGRELKRAIRI